MTGALEDLDPLFARLRTSAFRSRFKLGRIERTYLAWKGLDVVLDHARDFIARRLAPAHPHNDGKQTPMRGHPMFVAQHATGACCRTCLSKWRGMPAGRPLSAQEQQAVIAAIARWLSEQPPEPPPVGAPSPAGQLDFGRLWSDPSEGQRALHAD